jgi:serine/threonine protein kinase
MTNAREIYGTKWSEKEYLIVLHYYFEHKSEAQHADTPFVQELSHILGRTPHSILYRLQNYSSLDPDEKNPKRKGKVHITAFGTRIFHEWSPKISVLRDTAEAFLRDEKAQMEPSLFNLNPTRLPIMFRKYELLDEIGRGGFGIVFSCLNTSDDQTYALKVIDVTKLHDQECVCRFAREIKALRSVDCPNIISIHEDNLESEKTYPGFVMDLAEFNLPQYLDMTRNTLARPLLSHKEAIKIFTTIIDAVQVLHGSDPPILHRDINPNNIIRLFDGSWVLADFSLAKFVPPRPVSTSFVTGTHMAMGTAHYTAPEQYRSLKNADVRSDIFSLGWLLWDLFSSEGPYPRQEPSGLNPELESIFLKATSYDRTHRFSTLKEMKHAFEKSL